MDNNSEITKQINIFQPSINVVNTITIILIVTIVVFLILKYVYIKSNWDTLKCQDGLHLVAPFFRKDAEKTIEECTAKHIENAVDEKLVPYNLKMDQIDVNIQNLNSGFDNIQNEHNDYSVKTNNDITNLEKSTTTNTEYIKNAMEKVISSIMINTQVNKGVLNSVQTLNDSTISNIVDKYNSVIKKINK